MQVLLICGKPAIPKNDSEANIAYVLDLRADI